MIELKPTLTEDLATPDGVRAALQTAIELEHSTIPPYLYALYSLVPGRNDRIADLIRSVVFEEMAHMTLACNILNATGGAPVIDRPDFIPRYPGPLPGGVDSGLTVGLAPFSKPLLLDTFMEIEEPEDPIEFQLGAPSPEPLTIGRFYAMISDAIGAIGPSLFPADPPNPQLTGVFERFGVIAVTGVETAQQAILTIRDQGEGTPTSPMDTLAGGEEEPAHYYRFGEIYYGYELVATGAPPTAPVNEQWAYDGPEIPFDPDGVQPAIENPKAADLPVPPGVPDPRLACRTFNYTYTAMLKSLHAAFNGDPPAIEAAIGAMESLKEQAIALMAIPLGDGTNAGPSFEYTPVLSGPVGPW